MNDIVLLSVAAIVAALLLLMASVLARLWREQKKLKQDLQALAAQLQRSSDDIAGLCSAAVAVDRRLAVNESRISELQAGVGQPPSSAPTVHEDNDQLEDEPAQGYQLAIEKIRRGASVEDLVKTCGLTRDEAVLLFRLHGR